MVDSAISFWLSLQIIFLVFSIHGVDKSVLVFSEGREKGITRECIETFIQHQTSHGFNTMLSVNIVDYSTINAAVKHFRQTSIQDSQPLAIIILISSVSPIQLATISDLVQTGLNDNIFYAVFQTKDNCTHLQHWDFYTFKNSSFLKKINEEQDSSPMYWYNMEYNVMAKVKRRSDLDGALIVAAIATKDRNSVPERADHKRRMLGLKLADYTQTVGADAFLDLKKMFNFSFVLMSHEHPIKLLLPNPPSTSNNSNIIRGDIHCQFTAQTLARGQQFTLLQPMLQTKYNAFFTKPKLSSLRNAHLQPFQKLVWICISLTWLLYFTAFCGMKYAYKYYTYGKYLNCVGEARGIDANIKTLSKVHGGWWVLAFIAGKVPGHPSDLLPFLRICFLTGSFTGMIIQIFYSSTILSAITVVISPIKTFDNLVQLNFHFTTHVLSQPMQDILKKVIHDQHLRQGVDTVDNSNQITHLLKQDSVSTITYSDSFYREAFYQNYTAPFLCEKIAAVPLTSYGKAFPISFLAKKDSEFTELFNYGITKIMERGVHRRYFYQYDAFQRNLACRSNGGGGGGGNVVWDTVELSETLVPFTCYFVGFAFALVLVLLEKIMKTRFTGDTLAEDMDL